jgi:hypothetical protein
MLIWLGDHCNNVPKYEISAAFRQELYGSTARNCDRYADIDASSCRSVTQVKSNLVLLFVLTAILSVRSSNIHGYEFCMYCHLFEAFIC